MKNYAHIQNGVVVEIISTSANIADLYPSAMQWIDCTAVAGVSIGWRWDGSSFLSPPPPPAVTAGQALVALAALRYGKEIAGVYFSPVGSEVALLFPSDRDSRNNLLGLVVMAGMGALTDENGWKLANGFSVNLTKADVIALGLKLAAYVAACFAREQELSAAVKANPMVDISEGWPSNA